MPTNTGASTCTVYRVPANHSNPDTLPGAKLEKSDAGRERLKAFTDKVLQKICRSWSSPAELGSGVKSAILHALENNPRPGWIRADAMPNLVAAEKLKQRIEQLEEKLKRQRTAGRLTFPSGEEVIQVPVAVRTFREHSEHIPRGRTHGKVVTHLAHLTWNEFVLIVKTELQVGVELNQLGEVLNLHIKKMLKSIATSITGDSNPKYVCEASKETVEVVLKTLMARKLITMKVGHYGNWSNPIYRFTPKGLQHLAELQAISTKT